MSLIALLTWIMTASLGLYLLSVWLIEYDKDFQADAETRLPPLVLTAHVALGGSGLIVWAYYLFFGNDDLAWIATGAILLGASLGTFMAFRWLAVYQAKRKLLRLERLTRVWPRGGVAVLDQQKASPGDTPRAGPPERNFPLPVVVAHGVFATATITLVVLVAAGVGGS